jgi:predicted nucleotide-binding protein
MPKSPSTAESEPSTTPAKAYLSQSDVPAHGLRDALRVAEALRDQYGKQPTKPISVAQALDLAPKGGHFKMLTGAAVAYGITDAGGQAEKIGLTQLGRRIVAPTVEGDDVAAMREALLTPRVVGEFLRKYDGSPLPAPGIGENVLEERGVPPKATARTFELIVNEAEALGLLVEIKGKRYVKLEPTSAAPLVADVRSNGHGDTDSVELTTTSEDTYEEEEATPVAPVAKALPETNNRVFVTHGSNKAVVGQIEEILKYGKFEPVVSVAKESTAKPVPDKVMDDMRSCHAGIVHVSTEKLLRDENDVEVRMLNPNVLIEIGAAMALYGRRFVLLVEKGVTLPSNLQGLYEVRYEGSELDYEATMKLLKAFNEFQSV